jgi:hypothetical protein
MSFCLSNAPFDFWKRMENIFNDLEFCIGYIDHILVCSKYLKEHIVHLGISYYKVFQHGLALFEKKMEIGLTKINFRGLIIAGAKFELQDHVLRNP